MPRIRTEPRRQSITIRKPVAAEDRQAAAQRMAANQFKPGQSGNPLGRGKGSRNKLGEVFIDALQADFVQNGDAVIVKVREERPADYLKVVASLLPKEYHVRDASLDGMTDEELSDIITAIRSARAEGSRDDSATRSEPEGRITEPDQLH